MTRSQQVEGATIEGEPVRKWIHERVTTAAQEAARNRVEVEKHSGFFLSLQYSLSNFHPVHPGGSLQEKHGAAIQSETDQGEKRTGEQIGAGSG